MAILTDFEEFRLFDCLDPYPLTTNSLDQFNRHVVSPFDWTCRNYFDDFPQLWDSFERNQVAKGSLNEFVVTAEHLAANRKTPDKTFLNDLRDWRLSLARNMFKDNRQISEEILTHATECLLNRIVFLKALTDREIERDYLSELIEARHNLISKSENLKII